MIVCHVNGEKYAKHNPDDLVRLLDGKAHENEFDFYAFDQASEFIRKGDYDEKGKHNDLLERGRGRTFKAGQRKRSYRGDNRKGDVSE